MIKPNITPEELKAYVVASATSITNSINELVASGRITRAEADKYSTTAIAPITHPVYVVAIRGYYKNSMGKKGENDRGIFDDAFILVGTNYFQTFNANTDPRIVKAGVGILLPGLHYFKQGWHGYGKASGHKAFRTANAREVLPVLRDGQKGIKEGVTVNLHKGGIYNTNSIACQTVQAEQWEDFRKSAYQMMDKEGQKVLPYLLIEE